MMGEVIRKHRFNKASGVLLEKILSIIDMYSERDIKMTLRQLYYQLVASALIPNTQRAYAKLSCLLVDARYAGIVPWDIIEDRVRIPSMNSEFTGIKDLIDSAKLTYRLERWEGQKYYVELWTEKDAISSVISPIVDEFHIAMAVNRGYSSATAMKGAADRFAYEQTMGKQCVILYLGDHDPSGLDMVRDIHSRESEFNIDIHVEHIALVMKQIKKLKPPPNPAKETDPRAKWYIKKYGHKSWEVDAIDPDGLGKIIRSGINKYLDVKLMNEIIKDEGEDLKGFDDWMKGVPIDNLVKSFQKLKYTKFKSKKGKHYQQQLKINKQIDKSLGLLKTYKAKNIIA